MTLSEPRLARWWARRTIRFRLALWYGVGGTLLLTVFAVTLYSFVAVRMGRPLDYQLRGDLARLEKTLSVKPDRTLLWSGAEIVRGHLKTSQFGSPQNQPP